MLSDVLEVGSLVGVRALADELDRVAEATTAAADQPLEALRALADAVAVLRDGGLVSGAAAESCGELLRRRIDGVADRARLAAEGARTALGVFEKADGEVAHRVGGR